MNTGSASSLSNWVSNNCWQCSSKTYGGCRFRFFSGYFRPPEHIKAVDQIVSITLYIHEIDTLITLVAGTWGGFGGWGHWSWSRGEEVWEIVIIRRNSLRWNWFVTATGRNVLKTNNNNWTPKDRIDIWLMSVSKIFKHNLKLRYIIYSVLTRWRGSGRSFTSHLG